MGNYSEWDRIYRAYPLEELGWELGKPRPILVEYMKKGLLPSGRALDTCCGAGTNTTYLAQNHLEVTGIDISKTAITIAKQKAQTVGASIDFLVGSFIDLSFCDSVFDFVWDMGCFHHVAVKERAAFIADVHRVLKPQGAYMLTCFSYQNGSRWNHFTKQQLIDLFGDYFGFGEFQHYPSLEGDGVIRYFYTVLMHKK
jgi:ubiquinone/menaquinone biosynthesis C-methylase UbiE